MQLAIVVPAHNEASNLPKLFESLQKALAGEPEDWHVLFVDDGSSDDTLSVLEKLSRTSPRVRFLSLSRNFGQQSALTAGLDHAEGDAVVTMDADLQHPPGLLPAMLEKWRNGVEIVHTVRTKTEGVHWMKTSSSRLFYPIFGWLSETHLECGTADFRLMDRRVVDVLRNMPERARFIRGMIGWVGFQSQVIEYTAPPRLHGGTHYTFGKMLSFAWTAIRSFSTRPLRIATWIGLITSLFGMLYFVYVLYIRLFAQTAIPGWTSILSAILILGGLQLFCIGVLGEYLALVFEESKHRPLYVIRKTGNLASGKRSPSAIGEKPG